jgi:chemotaxis-related protein WspB
MLLVLFRSGGSLYAVDARRVVEVVPRVGVRPVPHAPPEMIGLLAYRGRVVPVIDFGVLNGGLPARDALSSRVIVAGFPGHDQAERRVGLLAEDVSRVSQAAPSQVVLPSMGLDTAAYLDTIYRLDDGLVQVVDVSKLVSGPLESALFGGGNGTN